MTRARVHGERVHGVWCATLTPLDRHGAIDGVRWCAHVASLFDAGIDGLAPFGTTGEGQSFSVAERRAGIETLLAAGFDPRRIVPATGCAAVTDAIELTRHAVHSGCLGALVLPPFLFKAIGDDGVFASYARLIEGVADARLRLYLYHIPQVSGVAVGHRAVERLLDAFPGVIAGVKDSSGDLHHTLAMVRRFPALNIMVGHEPHLPAVLAAGGAGTICGLANLYPRILRRLHDAAGDAASNTARELAFIEGLIGALTAHSLNPALKSVRATIDGDERWLAVRPPLIALGGAERHALAEALQRLGPPPAMAA